MPSHLEIEGSIFRVGDHLVSTDVSGDIEMCPVGTDVEIACFSTRNDRLYIGVKSFRDIQNWHDLDGRCPHGRGLWLTKSTLAKCFEKKENHYVVNGSFTHRKKDLKGMRFRLLTVTSRDNMILAEMEEDVGGGGGDGMGKAGHCVLLPAGLASRSQSKKKSK